MPVHTPADASRRLTCLIVAGSGGDGLLGWIGYARAAMDITLATDPSDPAAYAAARRACAQWGVPLVLLTPQGTPAAAVAASRRWDCVEVWSATDPSLLAALQAPGALTVLVPHDTEPAPAAAAAADLVLCRSARQTDALAQRLPGASTLRLAYPLADDALFHPGDGPRNRTVLAMVDGASSTAGPLLAAFQAAFTRDPSLRLTLAGTGAPDVAVPASLLPATERLGPLTGEALASLYRRCAAAAIFPPCSAPFRTVEALLSGAAAVLAEEPPAGSAFEALPGVYAAGTTSPAEAGDALLRAVNAPPNPGRRTAAQARFGTAAAGARKLALLREAAVDKAARAAARQKRGPHPALLQVTPQHLGRPNPHGGPERYVDNLCRAVRLAAGSGMSCRILSCGPAEADGRDDQLILPGDPATPDSFDPAALDAVLASAAVVHVHQCLTRFGLFVAARARLLGRRVVGTDHGDGLAPFLVAQPHLAGLFDVLQTYSACGDTAVLDLPVRTVCIPGPVDDAAFPLMPDAARDPSLVVAIGRVLPHRGYEAAIRALPPSSHLVIAGVQPDPDYLGFLRNQARGWDVRFEPALDDPALRGLMARAGLCVQTSTHTDYLGHSHLWPERLGLAPLECMATGMPAIVTAAGALAALAALPGCAVATSQDALAKLLQRHAEGTLPWPSGQTIRAAAVSAYGLRQFGERYLALLDGLPPCAS